MHPYRTQPNRVSRHLHEVPCGTGMFGVFDGLQLVVGSWRWVAREALSCYAPTPRSRATAGPDRIWSLVVGS
jgi:hypothetical protein